MQNQFYSQKLQLSHAFLRINIKEERYLGEAQVIFEQAMKNLFSKDKSNSGRVMQTKTFVQKNPERGDTTP